MRHASSTSREGRLWLAAGACLVAIYSSLYVARFAAEALRERNLLRLAVGASFAVAVALVAAALVRRRPGRREVVVLALAGAVYLAAFFYLSIPEERVHLLQYGLFGGLVYAALSERQRTRRPEPGGSPPSALWPAVVAVLITAAAGWVDEGIQHLLPNRHYDLRDVALNAAAGFLAVAAMVGVGWARAES